MSDKLIPFEALVGLAGFPTIKFNILAANSCDAVMRALELAHADGDEMCDQIKIKVTALHVAQQPAPNYFMRAEVGGDDEADQLRAEQKHRDALLIADINQATKLL